MLEFFETYKSRILYGAIVLVSMLVLFFLTNRIYKYLVKKKKEKSLDELSISLKLAKRTLNLLWGILGAVALSFIFVDKEDYGDLHKDFKLVAYLGVVTIITIVATSAANMWFKRRVRAKIEQDQDPTAFKFLRYVVVSVIAITGILFGLLTFPSLKGVAQTALGGAGVIAIIIGVASQEALANLIGGVFIIAFKPFKIGDFVQVNESMVGSVTDITLRHTIIRNFDNKMIVIPNSVINKERLINYDLGESKCCERIEIGISYDSNVELAKKIMREECEKHPLIYDNRTALEKMDSQPIVRTALTKLNNSSVTIRAWAWARDFEDSFTLKCDILESVKKRFENEGIEIPYPYHTIVMKSKAGTEEFEGDNKDLL